MKKIIYVCISLITNLLALTACQPNQSVYSPDFLIMDENAPAGTLMQNIKENNWTFCLIDDKGDVEATPGNTDPSLALTADLAPWEGLIRDAVEQWLQPLRSFGGKNLVSSIEFVSDTEACESPLPNQSTLKIAVSRTHVHANYNKHTKTISISMVDRVKPTLVHELGHAFGLHDGYHQMKGFKPGQGDTMMSTLNHENLTPDDIEGIRWIYCTLYREDNPEGCDKLRMPGTVPPEALGNAQTFQINGVKTKDYLFVEFGAVVVTKVPPRKVVFRQKDFPSKEAAEAAVAHFSADYHLISISERRISGAEVVEVQTGCIVERFGLKVGDIISALQNLKIRNAGDFETVTTMPNYGRMIEIELVNKDGTIANRLDIVWPSDEQSK